MDILFPEFKELLHMLAKHDVEYMLVGGYAVIIYGYERGTSDMDIWLKPDNANKEKLLAALNDYGIEENSLEQIRTMDFTCPQMFFLGQSPRRTDFLTKISTVTFDEAAIKAKRMIMGNTEISIIHYDHLILSMFTSARLKDKADVG